MFRGDPLPAAGEPLWTDRDRAEAVALVIEEADACTGCGQPRSESTAYTPDGEQVYRYKLREHICFSCEIKDARVGRLTGKERGLLLSVERRD